jgi:hypothetical protein
MLYILIIAAMLVSCGGGGGGSPINPGVPNDPNLVTYTSQRVEKALGNGYSGYIDATFDGSTLEVSLGQQFKGDGTGKVIHYKANVHIYDMNKNLVDEEVIDETCPLLILLLNRAPNAITLLITDWSITVVGDM